MRFFVLFSLLFTTLALGSGQNAPKGSWQCSFWGQEWQMVPGPNPGGPRWELQPRSYVSDWKETKEAAYNQAESDCEYYSDTSCNFNSCRQKSR